MKIKLRNLIPTLLFFFLSVIFADSENSTWKPDPSFFEDYSKSTQKSFTRYITNISITNTVLISKYKGIEKSIYSWMKKVIKPKYMPSFDFVEKNIQLYPFYKTDGKEDIALLSYTQNGKSFYFIQTGGDAGKNNNGEIV